MAVRYENKVTTSEFLHHSTAPNFDSIFASTQVDDIDIVKYPISSSIFSIIARTPLPNSGLLLRHDLTIRKQITQDGYVLKSDYIDEESFGHTFEEAYLDFLTSIRDKYRSLLRREMKLSPRDKTVLQNIRSLIE